MESGPGVKDAVHLEIFPGGWTNRMSRVPK